MTAARHGASRARGLLLAALLAAVGAWAAPAPSNPPQTASAAAPASDDAQAQADFMRKSIAGTPYSALVVHTRVDIAPLGGSTRPAIGKRPAHEVVGEERHTYHARVLETFRGAASPSIRYEAMVDSGDSAQLDSKPVILTLCKGPRGLYWPGPGASFPADQDSVGEARRAAKQAASARPGGSTSQCD